MYTLWLDDDTHYTAHERTYTALKEAKRDAQLIPGFGQRYYIVGKGKLVVGKRGTLRAIALHDPPEPPKAEDWPEGNSDELAMAAYATHGQGRSGGLDASIYRGDLLVAHAPSLTAAKAMIPKERAPWVWRIVAKPRKGLGEPTVYEGRSRRSMARCQP